MKKVGMILLSGLLLVGFTGCNKATSKALISTMITKEANPYFHKNEELLDKLNELGKEVDAYMNIDEASRKLSMNFNYALGRDVIPSLNVGNTGLLGVSYSDFIDNSIIQEIDKELMPGLIDFIKEVEQGDKNLFSKSKIIEGHSVTIHPTFMNKEKNTYKDVEGQLQISFNPIILDNALFKQIQDGVKNEDYMVLKPIVGGNKELIQVCTPVFNNGETFYEDQEQISYYRVEPQINYQLYTKDEELKKIRIIIKKLESNTIPTTYFEPITTWMKNLWGTNNIDMQGVEEVLHKVSVGIVPKEEGTIGNYSYTIGSTGYNESYNQEQDKVYYIEVVISPLAQ